MLHSVSYCQSSEMKVQFLLFLVIFVAIDAASISEDGKSLRVQRQAYIWNARSCDNGTSPPYCCLNGASNPDCCKKGSGKYCCFNGAENPECKEKEKEN